MNGLNKYRAMKGCLDESRRLCGGQVQPKPDIRARIQPVPSEKQRMTAWRDILHRFVLWKSHKRV